MTPAWEEMLLKWNGEKPSIEYSRNYFSWSYDADDEGTEEENDSDVDGDFATDDFGLGQLNL